ncbi:MAG: hypothetical protein JSV12_01230 [Candidatus Bathyarchaeota archaeon]|nr:MAG: hypothetical protein JSV12_01230 [Candidatus Bathyarchaeota archaeon]
MKTKAIAGIRPTLLLISILCVTFNGAMVEADVTYLKAYVFSGQVTQGSDSTLDSFVVPSGTDYILVTLAMPEDHDFDLSLWDDQNRRTGGWISTESYNRYDIPISRYSGWANYGHRIREWITVKPPETSGTWKVGCYSYSGNGGYTIRVEVRDGYEEDGTKELGIEWINNYPGSDNDLQHSDDSAKDFRDKLKSKDWTKKYEWENSLVWERDFKSELYGGREEQYETDTVDIALYAGHGSKGDSWDNDAQMFYAAGTLSLSDSSHDDPAVCPHDAYMSWGDQDLEWIGFDCCHALSSPWEWAQTMNGLHLICGFATESYQDCLCGGWNNMGNKWADDMIDEDPKDKWYWNWDEEKTVKQSWFDAADDVLDTLLWLKGKCVVARVIGENTACGEDYLHGQGKVTSDPVHDNIYECWDHEVGRCCPSPKYHPVDGDTIMLYKVVPKNITEDYVEDIGAIFGLTGAVHNRMEHDVTHYYMAQNNSALIVSEVGGINYMNRSKLWVSVDEQPNLPTVNEARTIAENFLNTNGLMPSDASFFDVVNDTQTEAYSVIPTERSSKTEITEEDHIIETIVTNYQVRFEREIENYPVSSQLTVYIGENGDIVGLKSIWREVTPNVTATLIPVGEAIELLETYGSRFAVSQVPYADEINVTNASLAYYDFCDGANQEYLMPVYIFDANLTVGDDVYSERIAVPAVDMFVPPIPSITSPPDGSTFELGDTITFAGIVSYGTSPYEYVWVSDIDGYLGSGSSIEVSSLSVTYKENIVRPHSIVLMVTDNKGLSKEDMITVMISQPVGGIVSPVDKLGLLAPYIGLTSTIVVTTVATAIYVKRVKRRKEKQ